MYFAKKDNYFGPETAMELVRELGLRRSRNPYHTYVLLESETLEHHDVVWGFDARCTVYDDLLGWFEDIESNRCSKRRNFRRRMKQYAARLPFDKPCRTLVP